MDNNNNDNGFDYFVRLPDINSLVQQLREVYCARQRSILSLTTFDHIKTTLIEYYIKTLPTEKLDYIQQSKHTFTIWLTDTVVNSMISIGNPQLLSTRPCGPLTGIYRTHVDSWNNRPMAMAHNYQCNTTNHSTTNVRVDNNPVTPIQIPHGTMELNTVQVPEMPEMYLDCDNATRISDVDYNTTLASTSRTRTVSTSTGQIIYNTYNCIIDEFLLKSPQAYDIFIGAKNLFNKLFQCTKLGNAGRLVHKDKLRRCKKQASQLFYCNCSTKNDIYLRLVHTNETDVQTVDGTKLFVFRAYTSLEKINLVKGHFVPKPNNITETAVVCEEIPHPADQSLQVVVAACNLIQNNTFDQEEDSINHTMLI